MKKISNEKAFEMGINRDVFNNQPEAYEFFENENGEITIAVLGTEDFYLMPVGVEEINSYLLA